MNEITIAQKSNAEVESLAMLMAQAFQDRVQFFKEKMGLSVAEANIQVSKPGTPEESARIVQTPPEQLDWFALGRLMKIDPDKGVAKWNQIKGTARDEFQSGHRAASIVDWDSTPWMRARFVAIRDSFVQGWQPRNGVEQTLIDTLAQVYTLREFWLERLNVLSTTMGKETTNQVLKSGKWDPPLASVKESLDQAELLVDRFDRLFQRNLRSLRDLRRYAPNVMIANAAMVNIGAEQLNTAQVQTS